VNATVGFPLLPVIRSETHLRPFLSHLNASSGTPSSWRPGAFGVRFAPVPAGPASPPSRPLVRVTHRRPARPALGVPHAVHAVSRIGLLMEAFLVFARPLPHFDFGGDGPAKDCFKRCRRWRDRVESPCPPAGKLSPPSRSPSHQRGGSGGWSRGSRTRTALAAEFLRGLLPVFWSTL